MDIKIFWKKYRKPIIITASLIILQLIWGVDPKFFIINIIWLLFDGKGENFSAVHGK